MKPKTTSKEGTTTTDRERRRNRMNTLGGDKTRSRSTFRFFKKIAPTDFFFRKGTFFSTRNGEWGFRREGRGRVKPNLFIARGELAFLFRQTDYVAPFFIQSHHLVTHPVPLCFWLSFLFTSPLAENLIERIKHHCL